MRKFLSTIFFTVLLLLSCNSPNYYQSQWHSKDLDIPASFFNKNNALTLSISNDETFLYLEVASTFPQTIEKIKKLGLSIWFSKGATPHKKHGIHYPLPYDKIQNEAALEGFSEQELVAIPLKAIAPIQIQASFLPQNMRYQVKLPLSELGFTTQTLFTLSIASFALGKQEYLSSLTTAQEIERRLDEYKATPTQFSESNLAPFFVHFQLVKTPNRNP